MFCEKKMFVLLKISFSFQEINTTSCFPGNLLMQTYFTIIVFIFRTSSKMAKTFDNKQQFQTFCMEKKKELVCTTSDKVCSVMNPHWC